MKAEFVPIFSSGPVLDAASNDVDCAGEDGKDRQVVSIIACVV